MVIRPLFETFKKQGVKSSRREKRRDENDDKGTGETETAGKGGRISASNMEMEKKAIYNLGSRIGYLQHTQAEKKIKGILSHFKFETHRFSPNRKSEKLIERIETEK